MPPAVMDDAAIREMEPPVPVFPVVPEPVVPREIELLVDSIAANDIVEPLRTMTLPAFPEFCAFCPVPPAEALA
jgi:hypothetical protein